MTAGVRLKPGGGDVDHAVDPQPGGHPVQVSQLTPQAPQHGQGREPGRFVALVRRYILSHLAKRMRECAVRVLGTVTRNVDSVSAHPDPGKREPHPFPQLHRRRQDEAEPIETRYNVERVVLCHRVFSFSAPANGSGRLLEIKALPAKGYIEVRWAANASGAERKGEWPVSRSRTFSHGRASYIRF